MKNIKLYVFTAVKVNLEETSRKNATNRLLTYLGYYTNLKLLYSYLEGANLQSYSSISGILNKEGIYNRKDILIKDGKYVEFFHEITIRKVDANKIYGFEKYFSLSRLISNEINKEDLSLGKLHVFGEI